MCQANFHQTGTYGYFTKTHKTEEPIDVDSVLFVFLIIVSNNYFVILPEPEYEKYLDKLKSIREKKFPRFW